MRYLMALALCVMLSSKAGAQEVADPRLWIEDFMQTLVSDGVDAAHKKLQVSHLGKTRPHAIGGIRENMEAAESHGKGLGYEFVAKRELGKSVVVFGYYVKRELSPVLWKFVFYSPYPKKWILVNFSLSDELGELQVLE